METSIVLFAGALSALAVFAATTWFLIVRLRSLQSYVANSDQRLADTLGTIGTILDRSDSSQQITLGQLNHQVGELSTSSKQLSLEVNRLSDLREALISPGPRGGFGEAVLEDLLRDALPANAINFQHTFHDGSRVDATIRVNDRLIPIDSKFPLTAFEGITKAESDDMRTSARRKFATDIRRHIDAVAEYIRPAEHTVDYALMYIPGENIFHEILRTDRHENSDMQLWRYAHEQRVIPSSPNTLLLYIQTVALALRGLSVEHSARQIQERLATLARQARVATGDVDILGTHLRNARSKQEDLALSLAELRDWLEKPVELDATSTKTGSINNPNPTNLQST